MALARSAGPEGAVPRVHLPPMRVELVRAVKEPPVVEAPTPLRPMGAVVEVERVLQVRTVSARAAPRVGQDFNIQFLARLSTMLEAEVVLAVMPVVHVRVVWAEPEEEGRARALTGQMLQQTPAVVAAAANDKEPWEATADPESSS